MKNLNFVEKVLAFLQGGDAAKMARFSTKLTRYAEKQVTMREDRLNTLRDKIIDAQEAVQETILGIELGCVNNTESQESYCSVYFNRVLKARQVVDSLNSEIEALEAEIAEIKATTAAIFAEQPVNAQ